MHVNIAFVRFVYAKDQQIDCIKCLMEYLEGYLLYAAKSTPGGYVWIRQHRLSNYVLGIYAQVLPKTSKECGFSALLGYCN